MSSLGSAFYFKIPFHFETSLKPAPHPKILYRLGDINRNFISLALLPEADEK